MKLLHQYHEGKKIGFLPDMEGKVDSLTHTLRKSQGFKSTALIDTSTELGDTAQDLMEHDLFHFPYPQTYIENAVGTQGVLIDEQVPGIVSAYAIAAVGVFEIYAFSAGGLEDIEIEFLPLMMRFQKSGVGTVLPMSEQSSELIQYVIRRYNEAGFMERLAVEAFGFAWNAVAALSAKGVHIETEKASRPERRRAKRNGVQLSDYHVLKVGGISKSGKIIAQGNVRPSPRSHFRRGHLRHLANGKITPIPACYVHGKGGFVRKDYEVHQ